MNQLLTKLFRSLRARQQSRARGLRSRTDAIRAKLSAKRATWDSVSVIRAIRDGR